MAGAAVGVCNILYNNSMKKYVVLAAIVLLILGFSFILKSKQTTYTAAPTLSPSTPTPEPTRPISLKEISKHKSKTDCWLAIEGSVYNMTPFIDSHPGGDAIVKGCGTNATLLFNSVPQHSSAVRELLKTFKIGIVLDKGM